MLPKRLSRQIVAAVTRLAAPRRIVVFGSRARRDWRRSSDIDVAVFGVGARAAARLADALNEELDTLSDVDVVSFDALQDAGLRERILAEGKTIHERDAA